MGEAGLPRWCRWRFLVTPVGLAMFTSGVITYGVGLVVGDGPGLMASVARKLVTVSGVGIL